MSLDSPYIDPRTGIFRNKLGIQTAKELQEAEYELASSRADELTRTPVKGNFDMAHLCAIHFYLFQDVYDWAGELRVVNISKGGGTFCHCEKLESFMTDIHKRLVKDNYFRGLDKPVFVEKYTDFFGDVNALHPFREGNGRATRIFTDQLAKQAGYTLDRTPIEKNKKAWNLACALSFHGKMDAIKTIFSEAIRPIHLLDLESQGVERP